MSYKTSSPTVKCEKCEERLTDFEAYENHMAHMHGSSPSEESVVDWTLITDEDIITKDGNKYRVGGESINWSPNFDKEARIFLEEKYQKGKIEMLSKKKIDEAKKFVKALEFDTKQHYDKLLSKINGDSEYNKLYPNAQQRFPQNFEIGGKPFSQQRDQTSFQKINDWEIKDHGIEDSVDDPNAVMGSQTKKFSKGKYHIDEPVAKEQFSTSFYGDYLGESKATEGLKEDILDELRAIKEKGMYGGDLDFYQLLERGNGLSSIDKAVSELYEEGKITGYDKENPTSSVLQINESKAGESWHVQVIELSTGEVVEDIETTSEREAEQVKRGIKINMNHADFIVSIRERGSPDSLAVRSTESVVNKHGVEYELEDGDDDLYRDLYSEQIDEGDEKEVFELLDKYNDNYPYASKKDMENEIERTIGWVSDDRDIQTLVLQWEDYRYS